MTSTPKIDGYRPNVGLMIVNARSEVLMGERHDIPGMWQMPQGGIDEGEAPLEAAMRELGEETGLTPDQMDVLATYPLWLGYVIPVGMRAPGYRPTSIGQMQKWFLLRYKGDDLPTPPQDGEIEFRTFKWVPLQDVAKDIIYFRKAIYEEVAAYFAERLQG